MGSDRAATVTSLPTVCVYVLSCSVVAPEIFKKFHGRRALIVPREKEEKEEAQETCWRLLRCSKRLVAVEVLHLVSCYKNISKRELVTAKQGPVPSFPLLPVCFVTRAHCIHFPSPLPPVDFIIGAYRILPTLLLGRQARNVRVPKVHRLPFQISTEKRSKEEGPLKVR